MVFLIEEEIKDSDQINLISHSFKAKMEQFQFALIELQRIVTQHARRSWIDQALHEASLSSDLKAYEVQLDDACRSFGLRTSLSIHRGIIDLGQKSDAIRESIKAQDLSIQRLSKAVESLHPSSYSAPPVYSSGSEIQGVGGKSYDGAFRLYGMDDVTFDDDIGSMELRGSRVSVSSGKAINPNRRVVIKWFESSDFSDSSKLGEGGEEEGEEYKESLQTVKKLRHKNIAQVLGYSRPDPTTHFIVLDGDAVPAREYLGGLDLVNRVIERFRICHEMAEAQMYLNKRSLAWCGIKNEVLLNRETSRLYLGALGSFDTHTSRSGMRVQVTYTQCLDAFHSGEQVSNFEVTSESAGPHVYYLLQAFKGLSEGLRLWKLSTDQASSQSKVQHQYQDQSQSQSQSQSHSQGQHQHQDQAQTAIDSTPSNRVVTPPLPTYAKFFNSNFISDPQKFILMWLSIHLVEHLDPSLLRSQEVGLHTLGRIDPTDRTSVGITRWEPINLKTKLRIPSTPVDYKPDGMFWFQRNVNVRAVPVGEFWRYEFPLKAGEDINIATSACNELQTPLMVYFVRHLLGLSRSSGIPAHEIAFIRQIGFHKISFLRVVDNPTSKLPERIYFFLRWKCNEDGSLPSPWGHWSLHSQPPPDPSTNTNDIPSFEAQRKSMQELGISFVFHSVPFANFVRFDEDECAVLSELEKCGLLPYSRVEVEGGIQSSRVPVEEAGSVISTGKIDAG
ncbi:hypothetical protein SISSUDRAFT_1048993 [Sistotremastrum suecicum HHB10207 ss-3]|uniref:Protein kinase domain-containing protein n=1 Tax=Sistotremastrum suecicum HHB10207 ss-3 TaxID=1314776 RepID=A0A166C4H8_9AGAM|nr:hypothetical protein SISSUDRAFT_1048993 [Sistotremastrum suecicum HHB10207 ss-3]